MLLKVGFKIPKGEHPDKSGKNTVEEGNPKCKWADRIILSDLHLGGSPKRPPQTLSVSGETMPLSSASGRWLLAEQGRNRELSDPGC